MFAVSDAAVMVATARLIAVARVFATAVGGVWCLLARPASRHMNALFYHDRSKAAQAKKTDTTQLDARVDLEGGEGGGWGEDFEDWEKKPAVRLGQSSRRVLRVMASIVRAVAIRVGKWKRPILHGRAAMYSLDLYERW